MKLLLVLILASMTMDAFGQTQGEMSATSLKDFAAADKQLNTVYNDIAKTLDDVGKKKLQMSERAWLAYRDAQATFEADVVARGGTMAPLIYNECRRTLTDLRIKELKNSVSVR